MGEEPMRQDKRSRPFYPVMLVGGSLTGIACQPDSRASRLADELVNRPWPASSMP